jgi:hypothetical protein
LELAVTKEAATVASTQIAGLPAGTRGMPSSGVTVSAPS